MTTLELDQRCQALSAGDEEIAGALTALDECLDSWLSTLRDAAALARATVEAPPPAAELPAPPSAAEQPAPPRAAPPPAAKPREDVPDEETLLASLDPEVATAVRVKRRLAGRKGDIRELIREVEASLDTKRKKSKRSPWWS